MKFDSKSDTNRAENMAEDFDIESMLEEPYKKKEVSVF